ncbi:hypothetical protein BKH41_05300 [Helicobacter sp. 12S02232-10]|uniref:hypothetical protein n=1 Tax=Helicobacter sp. 12S02232-10 TaxID=1476197 RepID=UPI000BA72EB4|nr:hypothetical protein [Helicobacter sp. 12S02232-10]PAF48686.1 hypothetical protein BKH41_05300 [Helicobacter sp. 12S02232-10]
MKKMFFILTGLSVLFASISVGATPNNPRHTLQSVQKNRNAILNQFTKGSIVSGTKSTGSVRRWYLFNEGSIGSSYTMLGKSQYVSADLAYSTYIRSIESLFGGMSLMAGTELSFPIYLMSRGKSNILSDHRDLETKETEGVAGWGVQLPLMVGLEYKGFYVVGLAGYTWLFMKDTYAAAGRGANPTVSTNYDGLIYGGGLGYKISNVVNIGVRYVTGSLTNRSAQTKFDDSAVSNGLDLLSITRERGRDLYGIDYQRFYAFISYIF